MMAHHPPHHSQQYLRGAGETEQGKGGWERGVRVEGAEGRGGDGRKVHVFYTGNVS